MRYEWGVKAPYLLKNEHHKIRLRENEIKNYNKVIKIDDSNIKIERICKIIFF